MKFLPEDELDLVHRGRAGMRALRTSEVELLEASVAGQTRRKRTERRWRIARRLTIGVVAITGSVVAAYLYFAATPSVLWGQINPHAKVGCVAVRHVNSLRGSPGSGDEDSEPFAPHDREVQSPFAAPLARRELKTDCPDASDITLAYEATADYSRWRTPFHATAVMAIDVSLSGTCGVRAEPEVARGELAPEWHATLVLPSGAWRVSASISARGFGCTLTIADELIIDDNARFVLPTRLPAGAYPISIVCKTPQDHTGCDWITRQPRTVTAHTKVTVNVERPW